MIEQDPRYTDPSFAPDEPSEEDERIRLDELAEREVDPDDVLRTRISRALLDEWWALEVDTFDPTDTSPSAELRLAFVDDLRAAANAARPRQKTLTVRFSLDAVRYLLTPTGAIGNSRGIWRDAAQSSYGYERGRAVGFLRVADRIEREAREALS